MLVVRGVEWGPFYVVKGVSGAKVMIKFGAKSWDDGGASLVIGDWESPFREFPKWLRTAMDRFKGLWHKGHGNGYTMHYLYFDESALMVLLGLAPKEVRKFAKEAISDIRRRALGGQ